MNIPEIGLSFRQPVRETCFSGYAEYAEGVEEAYIGVEFSEPFEGDGELEIHVLSDADDCFVSASFHGGVKLSGAELQESKDYAFHLSGGGYDRYICLQYKVSNGSFIKGNITARIAESPERPWFILPQESLIECQKEKCLE